MSTPVFSSFHRALLKWYQKDGRKDLPWRKTSDPYAIYVSEIMLQQTQVKTVLDRYYFPFLQKFPTLKKLAAAPQDEVLRAWQGLGYYNRAINLHTTAKLCRATLPDTVDALLALPGIGRNTAHAIIAFAHCAPVAVMEANVRRVLSRMFALTHPSEAVLWEKAEALLDRKNPFDYNQAMMDVGAMICKKQAPLCHACPAEHICLGKTDPKRYPGAALSKKTPVRHKRIVILGNDQGAFYATPRTTRFLHGLYHFIETDRDALHVMVGKKKYVLRSADSLGTVRQQYSHFTLEADVYYVAAGRISGDAWHSYEKLVRLPMSMAEQNILKLDKFIKYSNLHK